jgi:4'-phosphopantetheinyl transferase
LPEQLKSQSSLENDTSPSSRRSAWSPCPAILTFPSDRIDIWKVYLDHPLACDTDAGVLSTDENSRAKRFHFDRDRIHFTRCRSALRTLLARYLTISADEICFEYSANGKPHVAAEQNPRALQFNVSHSAGIALIAVSAEHNLGVDLEKMRTEVDTTALAERFFSLRERATLRSLPDHLRSTGFYACWTRKEAFLKATGDGLSFPLADFSVTTHPDLMPEVEEVLGNKVARKEWFLADVSVDDGFRAAVAIKTTLSRLKTYLLT